MMNPEYDFFFLSYDEPFADFHFDLLKSRCPNAERVRGVKGIFEAVHAAAGRSTTDRFFVLDADGVLDDGFAFRPPDEFQSYSTIVWSATNNAIALQYGHGGLKLYDVRDLRRPPAERLGIPEKLETFKRLFDLPSGETRRFLQEVANTNHFNKSPLTAWRGAFRECFKLTFEGLKYGRCETSAKWLTHWCNPRPEAENSGWIRRGAIDGIDAANRDPDRWLQIINDFDELRSVFTGYL